MPDKIYIGRICSLFWWLVSPGVRIDCYEDKWHYAGNPNKIPAFLPSIVQFSHTKWGGYWTMENHFNLAFCTSQSVGISYKSRNFLQESVGCFHEKINCYKLSEHFGGEKN